MQSGFGHFLFSKRIMNSFTVLFMYLYEIILVGNSISNIKQVTQYLNRAFKVKDLDDLKYFLGLEIARSSKHIFLKESISRYSHLYRASYRKSLLHSFG